VQYFVDESDKYCRAVLAAHALDWWQKT